MLFLRDRGITHGCAPTLYCPELDVSRDQMSAFIGRFWRFIGGECDFTETPLSDVPPTSFAFFEVACIYHLGITTGTTGVCAHTATRSQRRLRSRNERGRREISTTHSVAMPLQEHSLRSFQFPHRLAGARQRC